MACCTPPSEFASRAEYSMVVWRWIQWVLLALAAALVVALFVWPHIGLHAFWNILIPAAPALLVLAPGVWRNICPMGTASQLPRRLLGCRGSQLSSRWNQWCGLLGVMLLLMAVPLRHVWFNTGGLATLGLLVGAALVAVAVSVCWSGKAAWCAGLCPIHAVERLYGSSPLMTVTNGHCRTCVRCTTPCPDASPAVRPGMGSSTGLRSATAMLMYGGFPGFIWGWFQVPDGVSVVAWATWLWPFGGMAVTLACYWLVRRHMTSRTARRVDIMFACASVTCYYWFRLPSLIGYGPYPGDGMLMNLRSLVSPGAVSAMQFGTSTFFVWWMVIRRPTPKPWMYRPPVEAPPMTSRAIMTVGMS